ncbi:MAG TPA: diguanylate cyclase [Gallionella sp.]|nr:diguanylate cyclase [Gallionella sp.]
MIRPAYAESSLELNRHIVNLLDSLSAIHGLTEISLGDADKPRLIKQALKALISNQDMERCSIFLLDEDGMLSNAAGLDWDNMLSGICSLSEDTTLRHPSKNHFRLGDGIMGRAAESGNIEHCPSCAENPQFKRLGIEGRPVEGALLCVPITCESKVLGVLNVFYPTPGFFNLWHERLLLLFCKILGRMLVNHQLTHHLNTLVEFKTTELTDTNKALNARVDEMHTAAAVFESMNEAVLVTDQHNRIIAANSAFTDITGYTPDDVKGKNPRLLSSGTQSPELYRKMWDTLASTGRWSGEIKNRRKSGELYIGWFSISLVRDEQGQPARYVAVFSDISERKASEEHIYHLAHHDALTGLPNRTLFNDRLQQGLLKAKRDKTRLALMFLDVNKFKSVNDVLGHAVGDLLLKEVAKRIQDCLRESDSAARIGGDEFVVLLSNIETTRDAMNVAEKISNAFNRPFEPAGYTLQISSSIGIAVYPEHGEDDETLMKNADMAMYHVKEGEDSNVKLYQPGIPD